MHGLAPICPGQTEGNGWSHLDSSTAWARWAQDILQVLAEQGTTWIYMDGRLYVYLGPSSDLDFIDSHGDVIVLFVCH